MGYNVKETKTFGLEEDPADALLSDWGTKTENDVKKLVDILRKMSRDDLADMLVKRVSDNRRCERGFPKSGVQYAVGEISEKRAHKRLGERSDVLSDEQRQADLKKRRQDVRSSQAKSVKHLDESSGEYSGEGQDGTVKKVGRKHLVESSDEEQDEEKDRRPKKKSRTCNESSEELTQEMSKMEIAGSSKEISEDADAQSRRFYVRDLESDVRSKVCQMLNRTSFLRNDFRRLAAKMKFEKEEIAEIGECDNPTDVLLQEWGTQKDSTVDNLIKLLQKMNRDDVAEILKISMQQQR